MLVHDHADGRSLDNVDYAHTLKLSKPQTNNVRLISSSPVDFSQLYIAWDQKLARPFLISPLLTVRWEDVNEVRASPAFIFDHLFVHVYTYFCHVSIMLLLP